MSSWTSVWSLWITLTPYAAHHRTAAVGLQGYRICLIFLKLFERVYAPLTAGLLRPITADTRLAPEKLHKLDRLYQRIVEDLDALWNAVGLRAAA